MSKRLVRLFGSLHPSLSFISSNLGNEGPSHFEISNVYHERKLEARDSETTLYLKAFYHCTIINHLSARNHRKMLSKMRWTRRSGEVTVFLQWVSLLLSCSLVVQVNAQLTDAAADSADQSDTAWSKLNYLVKLLPQVTSAQANPSKTEIETNIWRKDLLVSDDGYVPLELIPHDNTTSVLVLMEKATDLGFRFSSQWGHVIAGQFPLSNLSQLAMITELRFARPTSYSSNVVTGEAIKALKVDQLRLNIPNLDGTGVAVGVLSDTFNCLSGEAADIASGDLPAAGVTVLKEGACGSGTDEGRAMAQLIFDIAPGSPLYYHTAINGEVDFANGIIQLAKAGCKVIVDDISLLSEPFFIDGPVAQAVDKVSRDGVTYVSSAGNYGSQTYESAFVPSGSVNKFGELHNWAIISVQTRLPLNLKGRSNGLVRILLQWDQPFFSVTASVKASSVLSVVLYDPNGTAVESPVFNGDAYTFLRVINVPTTDTEYGLEIALKSGAAPGSFKIIVLDANTQGAFNAISAQLFGTSFGHFNSALGIGVAASEVWSEPSTVNEYSARGGIPILFDIQGNRLLNPLVRQQPFVTGPDGISNTFFGGKSASLSPFPLFFGTSAAAPNIAGLIALMYQAKPGIQPADVKNILQKVTLDLDDPDTPGDDPGFDFKSGFGYVNGQAAVNEAIALAGVPSAMPSDFPGAVVSQSPSKEPSAMPVAISLTPSEPPSRLPTNNPARSSLSPSFGPSRNPSNTVIVPTRSPASAVTPTQSPVRAGDVPTRPPSSIIVPTRNPTNIGNIPTRSPSAVITPTQSPISPGNIPTRSPSAVITPTQSPVPPGNAPTRSPLALVTPTLSPISIGNAPTRSPIRGPRRGPTITPVARPIRRPQPRNMMMVGVCGHVVIILAKCESLVLASVQFYLLLMPSNMKFVLK
jgi:hypothetical protein